MELETAIDVIESVSGFSDETTSVGEAWQTILNHLNPHIGSSFDSCLLEDCQEKNKQLKELLQTIVDEEWPKGSPIEDVVQKILSTL